MNLESIKAKLSDSEFASLSDHINGLNERVEKARTESIDGRKSLKAEVEKLRAVKETLYDKLGLPDDADLDSVQLPTKGAEVEAAKKYERTIKKLQEELSTTKDSYTGLEKTHRTTLLDAQLGKAIGQHQFVDNDLVTDYVKSRSVYEDGKLVYRDGDKTLSIDEGIKLLATTKPHLLKAQGSSGSGFNPNATSGKAKDFKDMTLTERSAIYKADPTAYQAGMATLANAPSRQGNATLPVV